MGEKEFGKLILSSADMSATSQMPEIPIRPNNSIPITIGVLMIVGSLLVMFDGGGAIYSHFSEITTTQAANQVEVLKLIGVEITLDDYLQWDSEFKESNFHLVTGVIKFCASILIFVGGLQLCLRKNIGIKVSILGGGLWFSGQIISSYWATNIESSINISLATEWDVAATAMCFICNAFCILLPLIPLFAPSGRAALMPIEHKLKTDTFIQKEEE